MAIPSFFPLTFTILTAVDEWNSSSSRYCSPNANWTFSQECSYAQSSEECEGGGYLEWTAFFLCTEQLGGKVGVVAGCVLFLLLLFITISTTADEFFSPNVSAIVAHLKISESLAGVTFMAFGNGSPDIFASIASVLSTSTPKADLALGGLMGGVIFITAVVTATIVFVKPFKASKYSTIRDFSFMLVTEGALLALLLYDNEVHLWQPLMFLGIYFLYVLVIIVGYYVEKKQRIERRKTLDPSRRSSKDSARIRGGILPTINIISEAVKAIELNEGIDKEDEDVEEDDDEDEEVLVLHNRVFLGDQARSRVESIVEPKPISDIRTFLADLYEHLYPFAYNDHLDEQKANILSRIMQIIKIPIILLLKITIPLAENRWSKPVAMLHALAAPQFILFAVQQWEMVPIAGGPPLCVYAVVLSVLLIILISCLTSIRKSPTHYKTIYSYLGFLVSIAWIYMTSAEVVDAVTMLGLITGIDQAMLGLTIIAWANSIGDLVADTSIARQGYPRMAYAASTGGPLFNLLVGFGLPFTIAKLQGASILISFSTIEHLMVVFLGVSVCASLASLFIFRARFGRLYSILLYFIYAAFIVLSVLSSVGIISWH